MPPTIHNSECQHYHTGVNYCKMLLGLHCMGAPASSHLAVARLQITSMWPMHRCRDTSHLLSPFDTSLLDHGRGEARGSQGEGKNWTPVPALRAIKSKQRAVIKTGCVGPCMYCAKKQTLSKIVCSPKQARKVNMITFISYRNGWGTTTLTSPKSCRRSVSMGPVSI